jgi:hypothetical protein
LLSPKSADTFAFDIGSDIAWVARTPAGHEGIQTVENPPAFAGGYDMAADRKAGTFYTATVMSSSICLLFVLIAKFRYRVVIITNSGFPSARRTRR